LYYITAAFMTLCKEEKAGLTGDKWKEHSLLTWAVANAEEQKRMWLWAVARCIFIMWEHEPDVIKAAHHVDSDEAVCKIILAYARATLDRFSTIDDKVRAHTHILYNGYSAYC
jgi:hypothetical protein